MTRGYNKKVDSTTWVRSLGWEDPLEEEMATHSSILAWRIPWTEEPGGLQSTGLQRVGHDWATSHAHTQSWSQEMNFSASGYLCLFTEVWTLGTNSIQESKDCIKMLHHGPYHSFLQNGHLDRWICEEKQRPSPGPCLLHLWAWNLGLFLLWPLCARGISKEWVHGTQHFFADRMTGSPSASLWTSAELRKLATNVHRWTMWCFPKYLDPGWSGHPWNSRESDGRTASVHIELRLNLLPVEPLTGLFLGLKEIILRDPSSQVPPSPSVLFCASAASSQLG